MRQSAIAVSAAWDELVVNMVGVGTHGALEATEVDIDNNTSAVAVGSELDLSGHGAVAKVCNITIVIFLSACCGIIKNARRRRRLTWLQPGYC